MTETCPKCGAEMKEEALGIIVNHITDGRVCMDRQIVALKEELASESRWAKEYKEKAEKQEIEIATLLKEGRELNEEMKSWRTYFKERLDAWRAVKPLLRYPNWPDSGNQWITDAIEKLKSLGEL